MGEHDLRECPRSDGRTTPAKDGESLRGLVDADEQDMLRIERTSDERVTRLLLSGRIQSDVIDCIRSAIGNGGERKILDLSEVTLVDIAVVRFLIGLEDEGIELVQCPPYVREWIIRERRESA
jgi:hypothetical protein